MYNYTSEIKNNQVSLTVEKVTTHGDDQVNQVVAVEEKARRTTYLERLSERLKNRPTFSYKAGWQDHIPAALKGQAHWIVWKFEYIDGRWTKVPYQPAAPKSKASTTEPAHWTDFATAVQVYERLKGTPDAVDGVGYVFSHGDEYVGGDLDNCFVDGVLQPWAVAYLNRLLPTYAERSPSGKGIKFIAEGTLPGTGTRHVIKGANEGAAIELYDVARFFTITGDVYGEDNDEIADRSASILEIYAEIKPPRPTHEVTVGEPLASDEVLLDKARNAKNGEEFRALYDEGAVQGSHSEADFQLCMRLAWWFNHNPEAIDRVFRASALMRPKWDEPRGGCTYGELTIIKASERVEGAYDPEPPERERAREAMLEAMEDYAEECAERRKHDTEDQGNETTPEPETSNPPPVVVTGWLDAQPLAILYKHTDMGNGERLAAKFGGVLRYCHPWKEWLFWDGRRWATDQLGILPRCAKRTIRAICNEEMALVAEATQQAKLASWAHESESHRSLTAMIKLAASENLIPILPLEMDTDPWLLNVQNCTLDLRIGAPARARPHSKQDKLTKLAPVTYDPDATCPRWDAALNLIFAGSAQMNRYWDQLCGITLTGVVEEQILPILYGSGQNGKSTIINTMLGLLGPDYAMKAPQSFLMMKKQEPHTTELVDLFGKRLVAAIETGEGVRLNEVRIKELTGSDRIRGRRLYADNIEFYPTHKLWMATNHRPVIRGVDPAIWRRILEIPFTVAIPADKVVKGMGQLLAKESSGILNRCIKGCIDWQQNGLITPDEVTAATAEYKMEQDVLLQFVEDRCTTKPQEVRDADINRSLGEITTKVQAALLHSAFNNWLAANTKRGPMTPKDFHKQMEEKGYKTKKHAQKRTSWYVGIGLQGDSHEGDTGD